MGISSFSVLALHPFVAFVVSTFYYPNATLVLPLFRANQAFADFSRILAILFADEKQFPRFYDLLQRHAEDATRELAPLLQTDPAATP